MASIADCLKKLDITGPRAQLIVDSAAHLQRKGYDEREAGARSLRDLLKETRRQQRSVIDQIFEQLPEEQWMEVFPGYGEKATQKAQPKPPQAIPGLPDFVTEQFEPGNVPVRSIAPELTPQELKAVNRRLGLLKRRAGRGDIEQESIDYLQSLDPRDHHDILDEADTRAADHNEWWNEVIADYKSFINQNAERTARQARLSERRGSDEVSVRRLDELASELEQSQSYPALRAYAQSVGEGNITQGLFDIMRDGRKGLESKLHRADDYLDEAIGGHRDYATSIRAAEESQYQRLSQESLEETTTAETPGDGGADIGVGRARGADQGSGGPGVLRAPQEQFTLSRQGSPDASPVVEPYRVSDSERLPTSRGERQPQLEGMPTDMEPGTLAGQKGLFEGRAAESIQQAADRGREPAGVGAGLGGFASRKPRPATVHESIQADSPEVEQRLLAAHGIGDRPLADRIKEGFAKAWHITTRTREHLPNTKEFDTAREIFRLMDAAPEAASDETNRTIAAILDPLDEAGREIYERKILADNLRASVERGQPLRFGFQSLDDVNAYQAKVDKAVEQNPHIQKAIENRRKVVGELVDELVEFGMLDKEAKANADTYFHQQVLGYVQAGRRQSKKPQRVKRGFQKQRVTGPPELEQQYDYNTSYLEAEAEWMTDAQAELRKEKHLREMAKQYDRHAELAARAKKEDTTVEALVKQDGTLGMWQPAPGNVFYRAFTIPEKLAEEILRNIPQEVDSSQIRKAIAMGGPRKSMVLPLSLVEELEAMQKPIARGWPSDTARKLMGMWKVWTLLNPKRAIGYWLRNITGDIDPLLAARPQALRKTNQAIGELWRYHTGKLSMSPALRQARDLGVIGSSLTAQEVPDLKKLAPFRRVYQRTTKVTELPAEAFNAIKEFNEFREDILRYAAFLDYRDELADDTLKDYGGAKRRTVDELRSTLGDDVAAAHLARNLLGDYGNLTVLGQWIRTYVFPFWSWQEINMKRWPQLAVNAYVAGDIKAKRLGGVVGAGAAVGSIYLTRLAMWQAAMTAWNHLFFDDEEEELGPNERANAHLLFGRRPDGSVRILRNTGAFGEFLEWFGLTTAINLWPQYENGQISLDDMLVEMAKAPANKIAQGIAPQLKAPIEVSAGISSYPDAFNPTPVPRDEAVANIASLRDEYKAIKGKITDSGDRARPNYWETYLGIGTVDPRREVLGEIYTLRERFLTQKNKPTVNVLRISEFRPMREAAYANDYETFQKARQKFLKDGKGTKNFVSSLRYLDPISARLNEADEKEFEGKFLNGVQRGRLRMARDYADELRATLLSWWKRAALESGEPAERRELSLLPRK